jgi:hypothetical protein
MFAPRQLVGYRHALGNIRFVRSLGFGHESASAFELRIDLV